MDTLKISYTIWKKHGDNLYCRVRQAGVKPLDVNLHTTEQSVAEAFVRLRRKELEIYNSYILMNEEVPTDIANKLLRRGSAIAQKGTPKAVSLLTSALDGWEQELRLRGKRPATIATYQKQVRLVIPEGSTTADFTARNVQAWLTKFADRKTATKKAYSVSLREFAKHLVRQHGIDSAILDNWQYTKVQQEERGYWSMQDIANIIGHVKCMDKLAEQSYIAYFWFLGTTGARQGEAGAIEWRDLKDGSVTIRAENNKSNKSRTIPLDTRILDMLYRLPHDSKLVFSHIASGQAGRFAVLAKAIKRAGAPSGGLHTFRHSVSMMMYKATNDIKATAQYLCHSEGTALKYYQASRQSDELRSVVDKTFSGEILLPDNMDELIKNGLV